FEGITLGARGWVSGLTNAFPRESLALYAALQSGDLERARKIYRWFMPLLHLDAEHDLVQSIKLAEQIMGRGSERVRPPRLPLTAERGDEVPRLGERGAAPRNQIAGRRLQPTLRCGSRHARAGLRRHAACWLQEVSQWSATCTRRHGYGNVERHEGGHPGGGR